MIVIFTFKYLRPILKQTVFCLFSYKKNPIPLDCNLYWQLSCWWLNLSFRYNLWFLRKEVTKWFADALQLPGKTSYQWVRTPYAQIWYHFATNHWCGKCCWIAFCNDSIITSINILKLYKYKNNCHFQSTLLSKNGNRFHTKLTGSESLQQWCLSSNRDIGKPSIFLSN